MSDLREKVAEHLNYPNKDSVLAIDAADKIIELVTEHNKELLKIAYQQLQESSSAYDNGCSILRQFLEG